MTGQGYGGRCGPPESPAATSGVGLAQRHQHDDAHTAAFVRAEVRRPNGAVVDPTTDMPGATMVALTNPIFLT